MEALERVGLCSQKARPTSCPDSAWGSLLMAQLKGKSLLPLQSLQLKIFIIIQPQHPSYIEICSILERKKKKRNSQPTLKGLPLTPTIHEF